MQINFVTLGRLAAELKIVLNWKKQSPNCFSQTTWSEGFINLIGMERAAATLMPFDWVYEVGGTE